MNGPVPKKILEELRAQRRRKRWQAFLTPLITLTSIVASVAMLMYMLKSCSQAPPRMPTIRQVPPAPPPR